MRRWEELPTMWSLGRAPGREMAAKRVRSENWEWADKLCVVKLVLAYARIVEDKSADIDTLRKKKDAWQAITSRFNTLTAFGPRSQDAVKGQWKRLKLTAKKRVRIHQKGAAGDPEGELSAIDKAIWKALPQEFHKDTNGYDDDATAQEPEPRASDVAGETQEGPRFVNSLPSQEAVPTAMVVTNGGTNGPVLFSSPILCPSGSITVAQQTTPVVTEVARNTTTPSRTATQGHRRRRRRRARAGPTAAAPPAAAFAHTLERQQEYDHEQHVLQIEILRMQLERERKTSSHLERLHTYELEAAKHKSMYWKNKDVCNPVMPGQLGAFAGLQN
ncbi:uncharacterized protein LOC135400250 isoform X2 [Ornithodoros turicata]|uniref:uncharacterized protein LOC135400250 isoform X2 n=1 Tax=Ornithodoros turicata TaxID=34597 RepID=UPI003139D62C